MNLNVQTVGRLLKSAVVFLMRNCLKNAFFVKVLTRED